MAGENFNPFDQNQNPPIGTGEGESPITPPGAPRAPGMDVRTFGSDAKSMAESGGGAPKPYEPASPAPVAPSPVPQQEEKKSFSEIFESPGGVSPMPAEVPPAGLQEFGAAPKSKKGLFVGILVLIIVVGLGAIGYFYVYPTFFGGVAEVVTPPPAAEGPSGGEIPTPPIVPQVPIVEEATTSTSTATTTEEVTPPSGEGQLLEHTSLFKTAADVSANVTLQTVNLSSMKSELEFSTAQVPILKEVVFKDSDGVILGASDLMGAFLSDVFNTEVVDAFEADVTFATYTNASGTWPVFTLKLKSGSSLDDTKTAVGKMETSVNLANLFLTDPGTAGAWKSGTTESVSNRYSTYSLAGAGLNYGWQGDVLVLSTSYPGFQETLKRLK